MISLTRFRRLAVLAAATTYVLVVVGAVVRGTGSGMGCPDWPLCHGQLVPSLGDTSAWIEWIHRTIAAVVGLLVLGVLVVALRSPDLRRRRSIVVPAVAALALTGFQAWLGKVTVDTNNAGQWVTAHLATAMVLLAVLVYLAVRARYEPDLPRRGMSQRPTLLVAFAAAAVYGLILFGAEVRATGSSLAFRDWPLFDGSFLPSYSGDPDEAARETVHFLHRFAALVVGGIVLAVAWITWRSSRRAVPVHAEGRAVSSDAVPSRPRTHVLLGLVGTAAALYVVQVIVGGVQIVTGLAPWAVVLHLALGAAIWALLAGATSYAYLDARTARARADAVPLPGGSARERARGRAEDGAAPAIARSVVARRRDRVRAYVALTKPRIIELLLVTTVPAMVLAARGLPPLELVVWTLLGGSLAAGAANAINCYLDRDIDELMTRTRRRPLPAHEVEPEDALVFGLALGVVAFGVLAVLVNLVAAFLTLLAIAFYVVVYTMLLKRSTPQNIVLGGAAGALPPVIGWAAVTGEVTLPALLLFAIVFYWTPPHFWALSLRLRRDYEAAGVPMLPVTHGVPETTRQIALYTALMVALTLVFFAVAGMGLLYLAGAVLLGGLFLLQALAMWRERSDRRAVRLYRYSISYLTALFALVALDTLVFVPLA